MKVAHEGLRVVKSLRGRNNPWNRSLMITWPYDDIDAMLNIIDSVLTTRHSFWWRVENRTVVTKLKCHAPCLLFCERIMPVMAWDILSACTGTCDKRKARA